jgi:hypothetical protein
MMGGAYWEDKFSMSMDYVVYSWGALEGWGLLQEISRGLDMQVPAETVPCVRLSGMIRMIFKAVR